MDRLIDEPDWQRYFNFISKLMRGQLLEMETIGLEVGDQIDEVWNTLEDLSYDPAQQLLFIQTQFLARSIFHPREIYALEEGSVVRAICVRDVNDNMRILSFRELLMLSAGDLAP